MTDAQIITECDRLKELLLAKHANYGRTAETAPCLVPGISPGAAILVRASDKVERIAALSSGEPDKVGESVEDTVRDLAGYCILWLALLRGRTAEKTDDHNAGVKVESSRIFRVA